MIIYLAGAIFGCTDDEAKSWREAVKAALPKHTFLDPMDRDYRGKELESIREIVNGDLLDISTADIILVNASRPSWGTAMEIVYAYQYGKRIIAVCPDKVSPWLAYHADRVSTFEEAIELIREEED
jgi:nucleoside 2-deoxyribosyltransferase